MKTLSALIVMCLLIPYIQYLSTIAPIDQSILGWMALTTMLIGLAFSGAFIVYEVRNKRKSVIVEMVISVIASAFLGVGTYVYMFMLSRCLFKYTFYSKACLYNLCMCVLGMCNSRMVLCVY